MDYIRTHWHGNHTLIRSFWINLVALRIVILYCERFTHPPFIDKSSTAIILSVAYVIVFQLIVYGWQILGLVRACDRYLVERGSQISVLLAQCGMALSLLGTLVYVLGAFQSLFADPAAIIINQRKQNPPIVGDYSLSLNAQGTRIHLNGDFNIGMTKAMAALLTKNPRVSGVVLNSDGGRITEGRGVARLIKKHRLNTYVMVTCKSACTTAFIAGASRTLGPQGKLGFHQISMNSAFMTAYIDTKAEQLVDLAFYRQQNIDETFLQKVFVAPHTDIWFPDHKELLSTGVVHKVLDER